MLPTGTTAPGNGVTPEGLLVKFSSDFAKWEKVLLAKDASNPPKQLQVEDLGRESPFRAALQSNKLFLVISDPQELTAHFPHNEVEIAGWKFRLDPALWEAHNTILIFKYQDRPLRDLVEQTAQWALAEQFNQDIDGTRRRLSQLVRDALDDHKRRRHSARKRQMAGADSCGAESAMVRDSRPQCACGPPGGAKRPGSGHSGRRADRAILRGRFHAGEAAEWGAGGRKIVAIRPDRLPGQGAARSKRFGIQLPGHEHRRGLP